MKTVFRGRVGIALISALALSIQPTVHASWSAKALVLLGTVTAREQVNAPRARPQWRVTVRVDKLLFGTLVTPTFTFEIDLPNWEPPIVGRRYRIETNAGRPDYLAESAPLLDDSAFSSQPFAGAIGYAGLLPDADRNASAVMVAFGTTKAPPARDAIVTIVAADSSMRATRTRFACAEHDDHDNDIAVHLEPITTPEWLVRQHLAGETGRQYPRVAVLPGDLPAARALAPKTIARADLPKGTRTQFLIVAVDADGDGHPDFVARRTCESGPECEYFCEEVWATVGGKWQRVDRTCAD